MNRKKREQQIEEQLRAFGEKEMGEMKLPESLQPDRIREKILEYERKQTESQTEDEMQRVTAMKSAADAEIHGEKRSWKKTAGVWMGVAAAALVLAVGTRNADLWKISEKSASQVTESMTEAADQDAKADNSAAIHTDVAAELAEGKSPEELRAEIEYLDGVKRLDSYEELFAYYQENGVIERREEQTETFWNKLGDIFYGAKVDVEMEVVEDAVAMPESGAMMDGADMTTGTTTTAGTGLDAGINYTTDSKPMEKAETEVEMPAVEEESTTTTDDTLDYSDTNVQVEGVDESDIIKTDGKYIYRLNNKHDEIVIYGIDGAQVTLAGKIQLEPQEEDVYRNYQEMLLAGGRLAILSRKTVYEPIEIEGEQDIDMPVEEVVKETEDGIVVYSKPMYPGGYYFGDSKTYTELIIYDVSDPSAPQKLESRTQEGDFQDVRMVDGIIYLLSYKNNSRWYICDEKEEKTYFEENYIPVVDGAMMPCDHIYVSDIAENPSYVIITSTDILHPEQFLDSVAIQGNATQMYASNQNIYLWQTDWSYWTPEEEQKETITTIMKYTYRDGVMAAAGRAELQGYLNNSFSMDEYNGHLRLVMTREYEKEEQNGDYVSVTWMTENQLFVLNEQMQMVGRIQDIAPGEYIKSARFFGDVGYFVTFRQTDPLFSVDLSDPTNPQIIGQLKIPGFSEYLHPYGEGLLLGIGQEADINTGGTMGVKLSMFDVSDPTNVREVAKCMVKEEAEWSYSDAEYDHKAILASAGRNVIGFSMESSGYEATTGGTQWHNWYEYYVYSYDESRGFVEQMVYNLGIWDNWYGVRGIYIGDYLYLVTSNYLVTVYQMSDWSYVDCYDFR